MLQALHFSEGGVAFNLPTQRKLSSLIPPYSPRRDRPVEHRPKHGKNECTCAVRKYVETDFSFDLSAKRIPHFPHITLLHAVLPRYGSHRAAHGSLGRIDSWKYATRRTTFLDVDTFNSAWRIKTVRLLPLWPLSQHKVVSFDCCMRSQVTELGARVEENPDLSGLFLTLVAHMDLCDTLPDVIPTISKIVAMIWVV